MEPRTTSLPGHIHEKALFVLTNTLPPYRPVNVQVAEGFPKLSERQSYNDLLAESIVNGKAHRATISIRAEPWISSETVKRIYESCQASSRPHGSSEEDATSSDGNDKKQRRHRRSQSENIRLIKEVVVIYQQQERKFTLKQAYDVLRHSEKFSGSYGAFTHAYQRACRMLSLPNDMDDIAQKIQKSR